MEKRRRIRTFEDLLVWQMGIELVKRVYVLTANGWFSKDFGLRSQNSSGISLDSDEYR